MLADPHEEQSRHLTIMPPLFWVAVIFVAFGACAGCATAEEAKVCFIKAMGVTQEGYTVAAVQCMTPEAFAESQK